MKTKIISGALILLFVTLFLYSNFKNNYALIELDKFDNNYIKQGKEILSIDQSCPVHINIIDTLFIFRTQNDCNKQYFHIYKYPEFRHILSFGDHGNGPNEFFEGELTYSCGDRMIDNSIWLEDMNHKKFKKANLSNGIVLNTLIFPKEIGMPENVSIIDNKFLIGYCISKYLGSFFLYDLNTKKLKVNYNIPKLRNLANDQKKIIPYKNTLKINNDCSKIVIAYDFFGQIDIFNIDLEKVKSIKINHKAKDINWNNRDIYEIPESAWHYFSDLQLTDNYIFALYNNYQMNWSEEKLLTYRSILIKFNWNGEVISKYILPERIDKFVIDDSQSKIIAILSSGEDHPFHIYDINSSLTDIDQSK